MISFRFLLVAGIAMSLVSPGCDEPRQEKTDIIRIEGVAWACNVNSSYAVFGSSAESEENPELFLPACEGDLLYLLHEDYQIYHRYSRADGTHFSVSLDTLNALSAYLNGRLSYMELNSSASLEAFSKLGGVELEQLSALYIADVSGDDLLSLLKQGESHLQGTGLILENNFAPGLLQDLLSIVRPSFLVLDDSRVLPNPEEQASLSSLELLWIDGNIRPFEKLAACCSNLESLIIANWEPAEGELLPLAGLKKLKSLTIAESPLTSLSAVEFPVSLQNLYLIACDTLSDINGLLDLQGLRSLALTQCERVEAPGRIKNLGSLQRLSPPPAISHGEFRELSAALNELEVLELIDCQEIQDLAPLKELPSLRILQLQLEHDQLSRLEALNQLELVILTSEVFDDNPEWIKELRIALPDTDIVPGSGLCLGSGWMLLLLPLILLFRFLLHQSKPADD